MTIALGKFTKDENDLFDIMDDWLRRDRFVFVGWSGLLRRCAWAVRALSHMDSSMCSSAPDPEMWIIQGTLAWRTSPVRTGV